MAKNLAMVVLLDYYGEMLTDKQRELLECYYNADLSLSEIAANEGITRQGVRDAIKRGEAMLCEMEDKLHLVAKFRDIQSALADIRAVAEDILAGDIDGDEGATLICSYADGVAD